MHGVKGEKWKECGVRTDLRSERNKVNEDYEQSATAEKVVPPARRNKNCCGEMRSQVCNRVLSPMIQSGL